LFEGCLVWKADLDKNGKQDLIIASWSSVNGPGVEVTLIVFDEDNRPVPWHSPTAYFDYDKHGLKNLVDLDQNGRAELLALQHETADGSLVRPGEPAIQVISPYSITTSGLSRKMGSLGGRAFPIFSPAGKQVSVEDWSTVLGLDSVTRTIKGLYPRGLNCRGAAPAKGIAIDITRLGTVRGCDYTIVLFDDTVLGRPYTMVIDIPGQRRMEWQSEKEIDQMLAEALAKKYAISFACKERSPVCQPMMIWAKASEPSAAR
jgi:hypothetical protein